MPNDITLEDLRKAINLVCPPLYYGFDERIERGEFYLCKETEFNPEFIICHPDDLETIKRKITTRRFVHLKDEPKEEVIKRILRNLENSNA